MTILLFLPRSLKLSFYPHTLPISFSHYLYVLYSHTCSNILPLSLSLSPCLLRSLLQPDLVPCQLVEFDHLISQPVIKDGQDFRDFVTPLSRAQTSALGDPYLRTTQKGEVRRKCPG